MFVMGTESYALAYWAGDILSMALGFGVVHELFASLLKDHPGIRDIGLASYKWAALLFMVLAVISCAMAQDRPVNLLAVLLTFERGVRIVQCGLLGCLFLFSYGLGLSWRNHSFGFALGFAAFVTAELVVVAARWHAGEAGRQMYFWLKPLSFDVATVVWAGYAFQDHPEPLPDLPVSAPQLESWNMGVVELLRRQWN